MKQELKTETIEAVKMVLGWFNDTMTFASDRNEPTKGRDYLDIGQLENLYKKLTEKNQVYPL